MLDKRLWLILFLGLGLRLILINQSFWLDEAAQAIESFRPLGQQLDIAGDFQPPLFHLWVHLFSYFGKSEAWLRSASLIPGMVSIYFIYLIGVMIWNKKAGLVASLLLATSNFHIFYSQELRPYMLAAMFALMSFYYLWRWLVKNDRGPSRFVFSSIGGIYSMYLYGFFWLGQLLLVLIYHREKLKKFLIGSGLVWLAFMVWLPKFIIQLKGGIGLIDLLPGWSEAVSVVWYKSVPLIAVKFLVGRVEVDAIWWQVLSLGLLFLGLGFAIWRTVKVDTKSQKIAIVVTTSLVTAFVVTLFLPVIEPKRLLMLLPLLYLLIARIEVGWGKWLITLVLLINVVSNVFYWANPRLQREQWRQAVGYVESKSGLNDAVLFAFPDPFAPWQWYSRGMIDEIDFGKFRLSDEDRDKIVIRSNQYDRIFVFEYLMDLTDPDRKVFAWLSENGFDRTEVVNFEGVGMVYVFSKQNVMAAK